MKLKKLVSVVLATAMIASMGSFAAMAEEDTSAAVEETNKQAFITKEIDMADGITSPKATFTFAFKPVQRGADTTLTTPTTDIPAIQDKTIAFDAKMAKTLASGAEGTSSALYKVSKKTENDVLEGVNFKHAGVYVYQVTESGSDFKDTDYEKMINSSAIYDMYVEVKNGTNGVYVAGIQYQMTTDDAKNTIEKPAKSVNYPIFKNTYKKTGNSDGDKTTLQVKKLVTGAYGDKVKQFKFTVTLNRASTDTATSYTANFTRQNGSTVKADPITFTFNVQGEASQDFTLANDEVLKFADTLPAGTYFTVQEKELDTNYTATGAVKSNGGDPTGLDANLSSGSKLVGEKENSATITNNYKNTPATGIIINNLPYVLMGLLAACGAAMYLFLKRRHEENI